MTTSEILFCVVFSTLALVLWIVTDNPKSEKDYWKDYWESKENKWKGKK